MLHKTTLKNGLRVLTYEMPDVRSVSTIVFVKTGSRNESSKENGLSHFLEHMVFKGTKKYPSQAAVAEAIEGIGGELNAWTSYDHTAYWNKVPKERLSTSIDVVSEMILNPLLKPEDLERERGVIVEEIHRYQDIPQRYVEDLAMRLTFPDHPLGQFVIGTEENIRSFPTDEFKRYMQDWYKPKNMVAVVAGAADHGTVEKEFKERWDAFPDKPFGGVQLFKSSQKEPALEVFQKKTDQAHLMLVFRAYSFEDPRRYTLALLNAILGEGMSSRLFMRIREQKGLAYSISSSVDHFEDTGVLYVHAGLNLGKLDDAIKAVVEELKILKERLVPGRELARVKEYLRGALSLSLDESEAMAGWFGKQELFENKTETPDEVIAKLSAVTEKQIQDVAKDIFVAKNANLAVIGPLKTEAVESKWKKSLMEVG
jgi:predicted Zn-dependent peptidase